MRATEHAPRNPFRLLDCLHGLADIVERGAGVPAERPPVIIPLHALSNGRRVVVVQTPPDVAARGRISVNLDGAVRAVKRENVVPVPSAGVGSAPSSAAMAWLTPGFLSSHG